MNLVTFILRSLLFFLPLLDASEAVIVAYPKNTWPPFVSMEDDTVSGTGVELISDVFQELNLQTRFEEYSDLDELDYRLRHNMIDVVLMATNHNTQHDVIIAVEPPYYQDKVAVMTRADLGNDVSWQQLQARIGGMLNVDQIGSLQNYYYKGFLNIRDIHSPEVAIQALLEAQNDYIIGSATTLQTLLQETITTADVKIYDITDAKMPIHIGLNKNSKYSIYEPFISKKLSSSLEKLQY